MASVAMIEALLLTARSPLGARCATHPERDAVGICSRCGSFVCGPETIVYDRLAWCPKCCALPDVEWLELYRATLLKKPSGGIALIRVMMIANALGIFALFVAKLLHLTTMPGPAALLLLPLAVSLLGVANSIALGRRWARGRWLALLALPACGEALAVAVLPVLTVSETTTALILGCAPLVLTPVIGVAITSVATRVFLGRSVPRWELLTYYRSVGDNPAANTAFALSVLGVVVPFLCLVAFYFALKGRRSVDPTANPPVGRADDANSAMVLSVAGLVATGLWIRYAISQLL